MKVAAAAGLLTSQALFLALAPGANLQDSGLKLVQTITVPNWTVGAANTDLFGFNPVTRIMYLADRTNHAVTVIDTHTNTVIGEIPLAANTVVNQPLIAIDLQQLVVSDGLQSVLVWNLTTPVPTQPDVYALATASVPDGMDYDPINQTVYVVTDNKPYTLVGISLTEKKIVSQTSLPYSSDLIKYNPLDGKIYISMEDADNNNANAGIGVFDPASGTMSTPAMYKVGPICPAHGIDIDPISNVAVVGCFGGTSNGNLAINLTTGKYVTFPDVGGTDSIVFNPDLRRFYSGSGLNTATTSGCPSTPNAPPFGALVPVVGVFDATHPTNSAPARLDGVACTGRGNHIAGVDSIRNNVLVPVAQYPANPQSTTTGIAGILVFHDQTAPAQSPLGNAAVDLGSFGTAAFTVASNRRTRVSAQLTGITGSAWLAIPTTVWYEVVHCIAGTSSGTALCDDYLLGDPLISSTVTLSVNQTAAVSGTVAACDEDHRDDDRQSCHDRH